MSLLPISSFPRLPILMILMMISLSGCFTVKPGAVKSGKNLYESFYVGEKGMQYFIKPLNFETNQKEQSFVVDFTFQYKDDLNEEVTVNFSLFSDDKPVKPDSLLIKSKGNRITATKITSLYRQRKNGDFVSRYSSKAQLKNLHKIMGNNQWQVHVFESGTEVTYYPKRKTRKNIDKLYQNVFVLLDD